MSDGRSLFIKTAMNMGVSLINKTLDVGAIYRDMAQGEHRTTRMIISDDDDQSIILFSADYDVIDGDMVEKPVNDPTVLFNISESAWIQIIKKNRTFSDAFFEGAIDVKGNNWIRDVRIWSLFFSLFKDNVDLPKMASILLHPRNGVV